MIALLNFLSGLGSAMGALGTAPSYRYPSDTDRLADLRRLRGDAVKVGRDLENKTKNTLRERHGKVDHGATAH